MANVLQKYFPNLEVQKSGDYFPGQRAAYYSSDLLLRRYRWAGEDLKRQEKRSLV